MLRGMLARIDPAAPQLPGKGPRDAWIDILTAIKRAFVTLPDGRTPTPTSTLRSWRWSGRRACSAPLSLRQPDVRAPQLRG